MIRQKISKRRFSQTRALIKSFENHFFDEFNATSLTELHHCIPQAQLFKAGTDQASQLHKSIYREFDKATRSPIVRCYYELCLEWLYLLKLDYPGEWALQRYPSIRIHLPSNISVFEYHRDSDYNHPLGEINHFLSLTPSIGTAALHVEHTLGWNDYIPLALEAGESAILNTSIFKHGDAINNEGFTRVSIDFRAIPLHALRTHATNRFSISKTKRFDTSDYYILDQDIEPLLTL